MENLAYLEKNLCRIYKYCIIFGILRHKYDFVAQRFYKSKFQACYNWILCGFAILMLSTSLSTTCVRIVLYVLTRNDVTTHMAQDVGLHVTSSITKLLSELCYFATFLRHQNRMMQLVSAYQRLYRELCVLCETNELRLQLRTYKVNYHLTGVFICFVYIGPVLLGLLQMELSLPFALLTFLVTGYSRVMPLVLLLLQQLGCALLLSFQECLARQARDCLDRNDSAKIYAIVRLSYELYALRKSLDELFSYIYLAYALHSVHDCYYFYGCLKLVYLQELSLLRSVLLCYFLLQGLRGTYIFLLLGIYSDQICTKERLLQHYLLILHIRQPSTVKTLDALLNYSLFDTASLRFPNFGNIDRSFCSQIFQDIIILNALSFLQYYRSSAQENEYTNSIAQIYRDGFT